MMVPENIVSIVYAVCKGDMREKDIMRMEV